MAAIKSKKKNTAEGRRHRIGSDASVPESGPISLDVVPHRPITPSSTVSHASRPPSHMSLEWDHTGLDVVSDNENGPTSPTSLPPPEMAFSPKLSRAKVPVGWTFGPDSLTSSSGHSSLDPVENGANRSRRGSRGVMEPLLTSTPRSSVGGHCYREVLSPRTKR